MKTCQVLGLTLTLLSLCWAQHKDDQDEYQEDGNYDYGLPPTVPGYKDDYYGDADYQHPPTRRPGQGPQPHEDDYYGDADYVTPTRPGEGPPPPTIPPTG